MKDYGKMDLEASAHRGSHRSPHTADTPPQHSCALAAVAEPAALLSGLAGGGGGGRQLGGRPALVKPRWPCAALALVTQFELRSDGT